MWYRHLWTVLAEEVTLCLLSSTGLIKSATAITSFVPFDLGFLQRYLGAKAVARDE